ncbi:hypothetical protein Hanom_Chr06g00496361 [Helianthus anomalus]
MPAQHSLFEFFTLGNILFFGLYSLQWRTQKLFAGGAEKMFNHIFKGCGRVFA